MINHANYKARQEALIENIEKMYDLDTRVIEAMRSVPRHLFVPQKIRDQSYEDIAFPIGEEQTISQPSLVAFMTDALELKESDKVLEIGTGSGYQAAILGKLAKQVISIERIESLAEIANKLLKRLGFLNITVICGDGSLGNSENAPYDAIIVTAAFGKVPPPLLEQLTDGGRLIMPVGGRDLQTLLKITKQGDGFIEKELVSVQFVP
ncbi:protein-L-isoaspartate(D-aspartate) O-methyltransferase, partial [Patescibacteria group bacterium]